MNEEKFDNTSLFDRKMEIRGDKMKPARRNAFNFVNDDLEMCAVMAESLFGSPQPAEIVLGLYDRVLAREPF